MAKKIATSFWPLFGINWPTFGPNNSFSPKSGFITSLHSPKTTFAKLEKFYDGKYDDFTDGQTDRRTDRYTDGQNGLYLYKVMGPIGPMPGSEKHIKAR